MAPLIGVNFWTFLWFLMSMNLYCLDDVVMHLKRHISRVDSIVITDESPIITRNWNELGQIRSQCYLEKISGTHFLNASNMSHGLTHCKLYPFYNVTSAFSDEKKSRTFYFLFPFFFCISTVEPFYCIDIKMKTKSTFATYYCYLNKWGENWKIMFGMLWTGVVLTW